MYFWQVKHNEKVVYIIGKVPKLLVDVFEVLFQIYFVSIGLCCVSLNFEKRQTSYLNCF